MELEALTIPIKTTFNKGPLIGAAAAITAFVGLAAIAIKSTFDWANEMDSLGDVMGGSNAELAAYNYALRVAGVDTNTFAKANVILEKSLVKTDGSLDTGGKALERWGIKVKDANGNVKTMSMLTQEITDKYASLGTQQERVNFLTEIYGKQGAALIDFFDVMNSEGGVGTLADKMRKLGLAIDPARYEQFNRSLEKLKIFGLSLAIAFTEKLMPVFEAMVGWAMDFIAADPSERLRMIRDLLGQFDFTALTEGFRNWASSVDWAGLSQQIIDGINSIDWAAIGTSVRIGFGNIMAGLKTVVDEVDWNGIFASAGTAFLNFMAGLTNQSSWDNVKATWKSNFDAMALTVSLATEIVKGWWNNMIADLVARIEAFRDDLITNATKFVLVGLDMAQHIKTGFLNKIQELITSVADWIERLKQAILDAWANFSISIGINIGGIPKPPTGGGTTGGGGCFTGDTLISIPDGVKPIEDFKVGDEVLSLDIKSGKLVTAKVVETFKHENIPGYLLLNGRIKVTPEHRIYADGKWKEAKDLEVYDNLVMAGGFGRVESIVQVDEICTVYNLHTDHETHNYFAGGILVHNYKPNESQMVSSGEIRLTNYGTINIPAESDMAQSMLKQLRA